MTLTEEIAGIAHDLAAANNVSDIVERLGEPEAHYPGNFDTPKRANAMLSCLCQEAKDEIESLRQQLAEKDAEIQQLRQQVMSSDAQALDHWQQLAASQAREQQLREAFERIEPTVLAMVKNLFTGHEAYETICNALALPAGTSALEAMIAKAGEVAKGRAIAAASAINPIYGAGAAIDAIRALPGVTLEDLRK